MVRDLPTVWARIRPLAADLHRRVPRLGFEEVKQGGRTSAYVVHTLMFGDKRIPVMPGRELEASEKLLEELELLAHAHAPGLVAPRVRKLPLWMDNDTRAFATRATSADRGVHRFGKDIRIVGEARPTRQQIVYVGQDNLEAFFYFDPDSPRLAGKSSLQTMANDWNLTMHTWVEKQGFAPSAARDKLVSLNKQLIRELIMTLAIPGAGEALGLTKDIATATVSAIRLR